MKLRVPYLVTKPGRGGRARHFWQPSKTLREAGWPAQRLADDRAAAIAQAEAINDQVAEWRAGIDRAPDGPRLGTLDALILDYRRAPEFLDLRPSTRRGYNQCLDILSAWAGDMPVRAIDTKRIKTWYDQRKASTPSVARHVLAVIRLLFAWSAGAYDDGNPLRAVPNPAIGISTRRRKGEPEPGERRLWSAEAIDAFVAAADAAGWHSVGTAVAINAWLGQREGDVLALPRPILDDQRGKNAERLRFRQSKTGATVSLPIGLVPALVERIAAELAHQETRGVTSATHLLVCESTGRPWRGDHFRHTVAALRAAAVAATRKQAIDAGADPKDEALKRLCAERAALWFMELRHTAVTRLAEAGCTVPEIASVTGHSLKSVETIIDRYLVRTEAAADNAFRARLNKERGE